MLSSHSWWKWSEPTITSTSGPGPGQRLAVGLDLADPLGRERRRLVRRQLARLVEERVVRRRQDRDELGHRHRPPFAPTGQLSACGRTQTIRPGVRRCQDSAEDCATRGRAAHGRTRQRSRLRRGAGPRARRAAVLQRRPSRLTPERGRRARPDWPGRRRGGCCSPSRSSATSASDGGRFTLTPQVLAARHGLRRLARPVGHRPAAPGAAGRDDPRVVVDGAARRLRHRLRRARRRPQDHRAARGDRHALPGDADLAGQGAAGRPRCRRSWPRCWPSRADPACRRFLPRDPAAFRRGADALCGRAGWALADEELAPGIRSVAVPVRDGSGRGAGGDERHRARGGDLASSTLVDDHLPHLLRAASDVSGGLGAVAVPAARRGQTAVHRPRRDQLTSETRRACRSDGSAAVGADESRPRSAATRGRWTASSSPTSPASWPARTARCCWPISAPR